MKHKLTRILIDGIGCAAIGVVFFLNYRYIHHKFYKKPAQPAANLANYGGGLCNQRHVAACPYQWRCALPGVAPFFSGVITLFGRLVGG